MKNKIIALIVCVLLIIPVFSTSAFAAPANTEDIVILYENDAHCVVEGYSKLAAMKKELQETYAYVGVVSGGDFIQGSSLGVISKGEYVVELMNLVGYDAVTLGNHEFDYKIERLEELVEMMDTKPVCSNFQKLGEEEPYFEPYSIVSYGDVDIAYIGITTPLTLTSSSPAQFKSDDGNFLYTFHSDDLYEVVQDNIDSAKAEGADYVIALSHVGYADDSIYGDIEDVENLIKNTEGFDVVLDAHSHTVIEGMELTDKGGNTVLLTSTGTKFENIGKLTISDGEFKTELIKTADYEKDDSVVGEYIAQIYEEYATLGERKVAHSDVDLITQDSDGNRLVRVSETNLGDLIADSFRYAMDADIGYVNGGGLRADILKGDITSNALVNALPFNNTLVLGEISGQTFKDMMETALMVWPAENGAFPHVSGVTFSVNTAISSSVKLNEFDEFASVDGEYRVYDIKVYNNETQKYEPIDLNKTYTIAAANYYLLDFGSGMKMLENVKILKNDGMLDVEAFESYIAEKLGGKVGQEYAKTKANITFTDGVVVDAQEEIQTPDNDMPQTTNNNVVIWIVLIVVIGICIVVVLKATAFKKQ